MLNEESLAQKFIKKGFWLYLFTFLAAPLGYITKIILARDLSMNDFGLFYGVISLITLLSALNDLWWTESLNYFLPKYIINTDYGKVKYLLRFVLKLQIFSSLFIILLIFLFWNFIAIHHFKDSNATEILYIISLFFIGSNILHICTALFSATQNTKLQKSTDFIRLLSTTIFTIALFILDLGSLKIYTWAWISGISVAIMFAGYFFYTKYYKKYLQKSQLEVDTKLRKQFLKYCIPTFLTANIALILSQIDAQIVTTMLGNEAQALYSNYLSIMTIPFFVLTPILAFLFPVFTELHTRKNEEKIAFLYKNMMLYLIILSIWILAFLFQWGEIIAKILFGEQYAHSGVILQFSTPFLIFNLLNQLNFQLLAWTGQAWTRTISFAIVLPINIVLNIWLISKFWVEWSALAVGLSWIPLYLITLYSTRKYFSIPKIWPIIFNIFAALIAFGVITIIWKHFPNLSIGFIFILMLVIYAIAFFAINAKLFKDAFLLIKNNRK